MNDQNQEIALDDDTGMTIDDDEPEMKPVVVPDTTDTFIVQFIRVDDGTLQTTRYPVLAWRIKGEIAEPVICKSLREMAAWCETWCFELRSGVYVFPDHVVCENLEVAKTYGFSERARRNAK